MDIQTAPIVVTTIPEGFKVAFKGSIHTNTAWIENDLKRVVEHQPKRVELDLAQTDFVSSTGMAILVGLYNKITSAGGKLKVVAIQKRTYGSFKAAHLHKLLEIEDAAVIGEKQA